MMLFLASLLLLVNQVVSQGGNSQDNVWRDDRHCSSATTSQHSDATNNLNGCAESCRAFFLSDPLYDRCYYSGGDGDCYSTKGCTASVEASSSQGSKVMNIVEPYTKVTSNYCQQPLTSQQCTDSAFWELPKGPQFPVNDITKPSGCYVEADEFGVLKEYFNSAYTSVPCTTSQTCYCSTEQPSAESTPSTDTYDCDFIEGQSAVLETGNIQLQVTGDFTKTDCITECVKLRNSGMYDSSGQPESELFNGITFVDANEDGLGDCFCQQHMIGTTSASAGTDSCYLVQDATGGDNGLVHNTNPTGSVTCDETGFQPDFDLTFQAGTTVRWKVQIGDDPADPRCDSVTPDPGAAPKDSDGQLVTDLTNSDIEYTAFTSTNTFIPYASAAGADPTCKDSTGTNTATLTQDSTHIIYEAKVRITVTETIRHMIERKRLYSFDLQCKLTRDTQASSDSAGGWTTSATLTPDTSSVSPVENSYDFPISLTVHPDSNMNQDPATSFESAMGDDVYVKIEETTPNDLLKFKADTCFFTDTSSYSDTIRDVWFDNGCPVDTTSSIFTENTDTNTEFALKIKAFQFVNPTDSSIYLHCDLTLCLQGQTGSDCYQNTQSECDALKKRKRRSVAKNGHIIEQRTLTVEKPILIGISEVITPTCSNNFVYDRVSRKCSSDNLLQVDGVYLDIPWKEEFAQPSSQAFQNFAQSVGYELYALMQYFSEGIRGVKVVAAREGSVILTIQVKYGSDMDHSEAFNAIEEGIRGTAQTRLAQILNIRQEKIIEYIVVQPHSSASSGIDQMTLIIIVVVVVLIAVLFISALTIWKVSHLRRREVNHVESPSVKSYDNPAM